MHSPLKVIAGSILLVLAVGLFYVYAFIASVEHLG